MGTNREDIEKLLMAGFKPHEWEALLKDEVFVAVLAQVSDLDGVERAMEFGNRRMRLIDEQAED